MNIELVYEALNRLSSWHTLIECGIGILDAARGISRRNTIDYPAYLRRRKVKYLAIAIVEHDRILHERPI